MLTINGVAILRQRVHSTDQLSGFVSVGSNERDDGWPVVFLPSATNGISTIVTSPPCLILEASAMMR
jgi:hypothetical protein